MTASLLRSRWLPCAAAVLVLNSAGLVPVLPAQATAGELKITIIEGDNAIVNVRQRVSREAIIQVEDENRKPVGGALVTLSAPNDGPSAVFSNGTNNITMTTDASGRVTVRGIRPNPAAGRYAIRIIATRNGLRATSQLSMTNMAAAAAAAGISAKLLSFIIAAGAGAIAGGVIAARNGSSSSSAAAAPPPTVVTPGTPSVGPPR